MTLPIMRSLAEKVDAYYELPELPDTLSTLIALASQLKTLDPFRAITVAEEAITLAQSLEEYEGQARAWAIRAYAESQTGQTEIAKRHAKIAIVLAETNEDPITLGYAYFVIGYSHSTLTDYGAALEAGLKGLKFLEEGKDRAAQANIAVVMLVAYSRLGDREQAEAYGFRALEQYRDLQDIGGQMLQLNNLAMHFCWMGDYETAERLGKEALVILRQSLATGILFHFPYIVGALMHTLADIAIARNKLEDAETYLQEGLAFIYSRPKPYNPADAIYLMLALGKLNYRRQNYLESRRLLLHALASARPIQHRSLLAEIAEALVSLYETTGIYRRALRYFRFFHTLEKGRYYDQLVAKMRSLEVAYEVEAARREMELLTEKNQQLEQAYLDLQAAHAQIQELSIRDGLTKLYNRQYFEAWATEAFQKSQEGGYAFAIMLCDIDNFKRINDTWLHHIGDKVLQTVAAELEAICPPKGSAARYGGEEFVLAVPYYNVRQITELAEIFRQRIENYPWQKIHPKVQVTISIGVMESTGIPTLTQQLIQADLYLYLAKRHGKNQVVGDESESYMMPFSDGYDLPSTKTA